MEPTLSPADTGVSRAGNRPPLPQHAGPSEPATPYVPAPLSDPRVLRPDGRPRGIPFTKENRPKGGRPASSLSRPTKDMRERARAFLESPAYEKALRRRLREGTAPMIEALLYHYAYGKPVDQVRLEGAVGHVDLMQALQLAWQMRGGGTPLAGPDSGRPPGSAS